MKRFFAYTLLVLGMVLSVGAVLVMAQEDTSPLQPSDFAGTRECRDCHRDVTSSHALTAHALTFQEIDLEDEDEPNPIIADFSIGEDVRTVTFADGETRAFTMEDVAFTLGVGRNAQAYVYQTEDEQHFLLPAEWRTEEQAWHPLDLGEEWLTDAYNFGINCASCHTVGLDVEDYTWEEEGVMCESCHGPGLDHVEYADDAGGSIDDEERALIYGSISLALDGQACGQCHTRGIAEDGIHPYPVGYYPNLNELSDVYTTFQPDGEQADVHWWATGHARMPNMQYNESITSAHPQSFSNISDIEGLTAECLACHSVSQSEIDLRLSNEDIDPETVDALAIASENNLGVTCASCHSPHLGSNDDIEPEEDPALMTPARLIAEPYALCTTCHSDADPSDGLHYPTQQLFEGTPFVDNVLPSASPHFSSEDGALCTTCHMPTMDTYNGERPSHTFRIIAPGEAIDIAELEDTCSACHTETPQQLQQLIDDIQSDTVRRVENARAAVSDDTPDWVTTALDALGDGNSAGIHNYAYSDRLLDAVEVELNLSNE
jgi:hypothetical protein